MKHDIKKYKVSLKIKYNNLSIIKTVILFDYFFEISSQ